MTKVKSQPRRIPIQDRSQQVEIPVKQATVEKSETADKTGDAGAQVPPADVERYEAAAAVEQKLLAAVMGSVDPGALARAQTIELGLLHELKAGSASDLAGQIQANGPALELSLLGMAAGVSPRELRSYVAFCSDEVLKQGDAKGFKELVELGKSLDSARILIDDYETTIRDTPQPQRSKGAELNEQLIYGVDNALFGVVQGLQRSVPGMMAGVMANLDGVATSVPELRQSLQAQIQQMGAQLQQLEEQIALGPRHFEGEYNAQVLESMYGAAMALEQAMMLLQSAGIPWESDGVQPTQRRGPAPGSRSAAATGGAKAEKTPPTLTAMRNTLEQLTGEKPVVKQRDSDGSFYVANMPLVRKPASHGGFVQEQLKTSGATEEEAIKAAFETYTTMPETWTAIIPRRIEGGRADCYMKYLSDEDRWVETGRDQVRFKAEDAQPVKRDGVSDFLARGDMGSIKQGEGKHGPKFTLKIGRDSLTVTQSKKGAVRWKFYDRAAGEAQGPNYAPASGRLTAELAMQILGKIKSGGDALGVPAEVSALCSLLEGL